MMTLLSILLSRIDLVPRIHVRPVDAPDIRHVLNEVSG